MEGGNSCGEANLEFFIDWVDSLRSADTLGCHHSYGRLYDAVEVTF